MHMAFVHVLVILVEFLGDSMIYVKLKGHSSNFVVLGYFE